MKHNSYKKHNNAQYQYHPLSNPQGKQRTTKRISVTSQRSEMTLTVKIVIIILQNKLTILRNMFVVFDLEENLFGVVVTF